MPVEILDPRYLDTARLDREKVRRKGFGEFVRQGWHVLEPIQPLAWGWCLDAICEHLEAVSRGELLRLLMNVPPGTAKSLLTSVFWPAWEWTLDTSTAGPWLRVISTSYKADLSTRDSRRCRDLVTSEWYRARWPELELSKSSETYFENTKKGWRQATAFTSLTGGRAHRLVIDDPHSTEGAESDADRARAVRIFRESAPNRLVDPKTSAIVVIMQRLHANDVSGEIIREQLGYEHLMLPMRFEPKRACSTSIGFTDPRTEDGDLLFPERFPADVVERDEGIMGSFAAAGQLQQRPAPREGAMVKVAWFAKRWREKGAKPLRLIGSMDCASKAKDRNDPSACLVAAEFEDRIELWHYKYRRLEFPDLTQWAKDLHAAWKFTHLLIEDKDAGQQLLQQLRKDTKIPVVGSTPEKDKETRLFTETGAIEAGGVWLPDEAEWVLEWLEEITTFPGAPHDESADTLSQLLRWLRENPYRRPSAAPVGVPKTSHRGIGRG